MFGLTLSELRLLRRLKTPLAVQDFLTTLPINFERGGETCLSPRRVLQERRAHCIEGAMLAALALRLHGHKPLLMDLKSVWHDDDHVVALFKERGCWGAVSKTNHAVLRYREPIYRTLRELALSYFHEYFTDDGKKTLRSYSGPVNLARFDKAGWMTSVKDVWYVPRYLDKVRHYPLVTRTQIKHLRLADKIERQAGKLLQWPS
ncbi:MAG: hypothetical protein HY974_02010 [Candidatus Kerfeldbacteria bacterium]|nr:hypothetical protein [Candidatus Kerfeldbacteria bacterium]